MSKAKMREIKNVIREMIRDARGLLFLSDYDIKIENMKKVDDNYEISGMYEYKGLFGDSVIESGRFKVVLDKDLEVISLEITPETASKKERCR